jgi:hypothetical protein
MSTLANLWTIQPRNRGSIPCRVVTFSFPFGYLGQTGCGTYPACYSMDIRDSLLDASRLSPYINFYFPSHVLGLYLSHTPSLFKHLKILLEK